MRPRHNCTIRVSSSLPDRPRSKVGHVRKCCHDVYYSDAICLRCRGFAVLGFPVVTEFHRSPLNRLVTYDATTAGHVDGAHHMYQDLRDAVYMGCRDVGFV